MEVDTQEAAGEGGRETCTATGDRPEAHEWPMTSEPPRRRYRQCEAARCSYSAIA
ncbi:hypothetical protein J6590_045725 [Homalodisca vitripennis]|nr:hypothetical protein J6590_045725 [Homalodisca vitripennis]